MSDAAAGYLRELIAEQERLRDGNRERELIALTELALIREAAGEYRERIAAYERAAELLRDE